MKEVRSLCATMSRIIGEVSTYLTYRYGDEPEWATESENDTGASEADRVRSCLPVYLRGANLDEEDTVWTSMEPGSRRQVERTAKNVHERVRVSMKEIESQVAWRPLNQAFTWSGGQLTGRSSISRLIIRSMDVVRALLESNDWEEVAQAANVVDRVLDDIQEDYTRPLNYHNELKDQVRVVVGWLEEMAPLKTILYEDLVAKVEDWLQEDEQADLWSRGAAQYLAAYGCIRADVNLFGAGSHILNAIRSGEGWDRIDTELTASVDVRNRMDPSFYRYVMVWAYDGDRRMILATSDGVTTEPVGWYRGMGTGATIYQKSEYTLSDIVSRGAIRLLMLESGGSRLRPQARDVTNIGKLLAAEGVKNKSNWGVLDLASQVHRVTEGTGMALVRERTHSISVVRWKEQGCSLSDAVKAVGRDLVGQISASFLCANGAHLEGADAYECAARLLERVAEQLGADSSAFPIRLAVACWIEVMHVHGLWDDMKPAELLPKEQSGLISEVVKLPHDAIYLSLGGEPG